MKFFRLIFLALISLNSCSKSTSAEQTEPSTDTSRPDYDTTAIDSFSVGATQNVLKPAVDSFPPMKKDSAKTTKKADVSLKKESKEKPKEQKQDSKKTYR